MLSGRRPNLFLIGAMKAGTTYLHRYLAGHPEIFMSPYKEPCYFNEELRWHRGMEWYMSLFEGAQEYRIVGESSTTYTMRPKYDGVVEKIANHAPNAKFIYLLRDPVERTISHYWYAVHGYGETRNPVRAIEESPEYLDFSNYAYQVQPYIERFGRDRIFVLTLESMKRNGVSAVQPLFEWLGVDPTANISVDEKDRNETPSMISRQRGLGILDRLRYTALWDRLAPAVPTGVKRLARRAAIREFERPAQPMDQIKAVLRERQVEEVRRLSEIVGRQFPEWRTLWDNGSTGSRAEAG